MDVAQALRAARERANKSQTEISAFLGIAQPQYSRYELGKREMPLRYLIALADLYEISLDELIGRDFQKRQR